MSQTINNVTKSKIKLTKQNVISAIEALGGKATTSQISEYLKEHGHSGYVYHIITRMLAWRELRFTRIHGETMDGRKTAGTRLLEVVPDITKEWGNYMEFR